MEIEQALTASLESALNRYLSLDPAALSRFASLEGRVIAIKIIGLNTTLSLFPSADGFMIFTDFDGQVDATIIGTPVALAKMAVVSDPKELLFSGEIEIVGDTAVANQFNRILSQLDIDWEEVLAQNVGDIAAHKMANLFRDANHWFKRSTQSVCLDSGEYIQEEVHLSPSNAELRKFTQQVDEVREAADRLEAKIKILINNKKQL